DSGGRWRHHRTPDAGPTRDPRPGGRTLFSVRELVSRRTARLSRTARRVLCSVFDGAVLPCAHVEVVNLCIRDVLCEGSNLLGESLRNLFVQNASTDKRGTERVRDFRRP
ncbi:unnamed protein product, partial [Ixodes persulcatus]